MLRGGVEQCVLVNIIILVHHEHAESFESTFSDRIQWMNDPVPQDEISGTSTPQAVEHETPQ
jgi:hypothetical protein